MKNLYPTQLLMKWKLTAIAIVLTTSTLFAQQTFYDVTAGNGYGIRFWQSNTYKIHMGTGSEYFFGPVQDYSIKMNMSGGTPNRGWTWGIDGQTPVAAINTLGNMQVAGNFIASGNIGIGTTTPSARLDVYEAGGGSGLLSAARFRNGNSSNYFGNNQLLFSHAGTTGYSHAIKTRHNSGALSDNAMDFYVWQPSDGIGSIGSNLTMSLNGGSVGIGTLTPSFKLHVAGGAIALDADQPVRGGGTWLISGNTTQVTVGTANPGIGLRFDAGATNRMIINGTSGNVGIGTLNPNQKLTVNGTIYGKEVKVDLSVPGPDYVFDKDYKLTSLEDIKAYIDQHKHLPEVPSAAAMEADGINLSEMNMILLRKIEELTLHLIDQNKLVQQLQESSRASADASAKKVEELTLYVIQQSKEVKNLDAENKEIMKELKTIKK